MSYADTGSGGAPQLSWDDHGSSTIWEVNLRNVGFTPAVDLDPVLIEDGKSSYTPEGLGSGEYEFYVRHYSCGELIEGNKYWSGPIGFSVPPPSDNTTNSTTGTNTTNSPTGTNTTNSSTTDASTTVAETTNASTTVAETTAAPESTTTAAPESTTTAASESTTTAASESTTTAAPESTTPAASDSTTTAAPESTTTQGPDDTSSETTTTQASDDSSGEAATEVLKKLTSVNNFDAEITKLEEPGTIDNLTFRPSSGAKEAAKVLINSGSGDVIKSEIRENVVKKLVSVAKKENNDVKYISFAPEDLGFTDLAVGTIHALADISGNITHLDSFPTNEPLPAIYFTLEIGAQGTLRIGDLNITFIRHENSYSYAINGSGGDVGSGIFVAGNPVTVNNYTFYTGSVLAVPNDNTPTTTQAPNDTSDETTQAPNDTLSETTTTTIDPFCQISLTEDDEIILFIQKILRILKILRLLRLLRIVNCSDTKYSHV